MPTARMRPGLPSALHRRHGSAVRLCRTRVDPTRGFGRPIFERGGARLEDALSLFRSGEALDVVADEYGALVTSSRTSFGSPSPLRPEMPGGHPVTH